MRKVLLLLMLSFATIYSYSQDYKNALGLKFSYAYGTGAGLNWKHTLGESRAFELSVGGGNGVLWLQGFYEFQHELNIGGLGEGFKWYWGLGADVGKFSSNYVYGNTTYSSFFAGVDGIIGVEYTLPNFPLNFALDTGPTLRVTPYVGFGWTGGFAIRYAIK